MTSNPITPGSNSAAAGLHDFADRIIENLQSIEDAREFLKAIKAEAKAAGFDLKALDSVIKAKRAPSQEPRIQMETLARTYLRAAGFPVAD